MSWNNATSNRNIQRLQLSKNEMRKWGKFCSEPDGLWYEKICIITLRNYTFKLVTAWLCFDGAVMEIKKILVVKNKLLFRSKLFIRLPRTLFKTEDALQVRKGELATMIQAKWKAFVYQRRYQRMRAAVTVLAKHWRRVAARRVLQRRKWAATVIRG